MRLFDTPVFQKYDTKLSKVPKESHKILFETNKSITLNYKVYDNLQLWGQSRKFSHKVSKIYFTTN